MRWFSNVSKPNKFGHILVLFSPQPGTAALVDLRSSWWKMKSLTVKRPSRILPRWAVLQFPGQMEVMAYPNAEQLAHLQVGCLHDGPTLLTHCKRGALQKLYRSVVIHWRNMLTANGIIMWILLGGLSLPSMLKYNTKVGLNKTLTACSLQFWCVFDTIWKLTAPIHMLSDELPQENHGKNMFNSFGTTRTASLSSAGWLPLLLESQQLVGSPQKRDRHRSKTSCSQGHPQNHLPSPEVQTSTLRGLPSTRRRPAACERSRERRSSTLSWTIPILST